MTKAKKTAAVYVCQSKDEAMGAIKELGDAQRELLRVNTYMNDEREAVTVKYSPEVDALKNRIETLTTGIQLWAEANRVQLCSKGNKSANLLTGEVAWRQRPPSVIVRGQDKVIEALRTFGLTRFLREKVEINKDAILAEPAAVAGIAGITVVTGVEDFSVTPFEVEVAS